MHFFYQFLIFLISKLLNQACFDLKINIISNKIKNKILKFEQLPPLSAVYVGICTYYKLFS